jgi:hypothetical protein
VGVRARFLLSLHPQTARWAKNWREGLCQDKGTRAFSLDFAPRRACAACAGRDDGGAVVNFVWIRIAAFPPSIVSARGGQCTVPAF